MPIANGTPGKRQLANDSKKKNSKAKGNKNSVDRLLEPDSKTPPTNHTSNSKRSVNAPLLNGSSPSLSVVKSVERSNKSVPSSKSTMNSSAHHRTGKPQSGAINTFSEDTNTATPYLVSREAERDNRANIVLHKRPFQTLYYFVREVPFVVFALFSRLLRYKLSVIGVLLACMVCICLDFLDGPHTEIWTSSKKTFLWWGWWVVLGFMSSCGLGTGLHTFVLYLGPFIAKVTLAAYECRTTNFPSPPYPDEVMCPPGYNEEEITLWSIIKKVQVEAVLWGVGTAIGELPPYFVARAARLSGQCDDEDVEEFEDLLRSKEELKSSAAAQVSKQNTNASDEDLKLKKQSDGSSEQHSSLPWSKRAELWVTDLILRAGFFGIVACASIPNPLFDLAGMTCGHFLVPFWSFFGATLIGKSFIKMHIQQLFVITIFTEHHVQTILAAMRYIPWYGDRLRQPIQDYLALQKEKLHNAVVTHDSSWLQTLTGIITWALIGFFVYSIVNSLAQSYDRRLCKWRRAVAGINDKAK